MSTQLDDRPDTKTSHGDSDNEPDKIAHWARKDKITEGYVEGKEVIALCGEIFVPSRDPEGLEVCEPCQSILNGMWGDGDGE